MESEVDPRQPGVVSDESRGVRRDARKDAAMEAIRRCLERAGVGENRVPAIADSLADAITRFCIGEVVEGAGAPPGDALEYIKRALKAASELAALMTDEISGASAVLGIVDRRLLKDGGRPITRELAKHLMALQVGLVMAKSDIPKPSKGGDTRPTNKALARGIIAVFRTEELDVEARANGLLGQIVRHAFDAAGLQHNNLDRLIGPLLKE